MDILSLVKTKMEVRTILKTSKFKNLLIDIH